jgi:mono/diheme cytochrome c family protein
MKTLRNWVIAIVAVVVVVLVGGYVFVTGKPQSPLAAVADTTPADPHEALYVAQLADCVACHSTPDGHPFAGGLAMGSPLGTIYSTNITPDKDTGIGNYTLADFDLAVRHGIAQDGHRLYPAMPYPSYAKLTDDDVKKLYDYFMHSVQPVSQPNKPTDIPSPYNQRWPLALWNVVFAKDGTYKADPNKDAQWNRGAYLVQSLGHCGACHTARGAAFNEVALDESSNSYLGGALLDTWRAPSLRGENDLGLGRWSEDDIVSFLKTGHNEHATVFGSMLDAFNNSTTYMSDDDLKAIAHYLKSLPGNPTNTPEWKYDDATVAELTGGKLDTPGAGLYLKNCQSCHAIDGKGHGANLPPLAGSGTVLDPDPSSVINVLLNGGGRIVANGVPDSYRMTPFRVLLKDQQIADLATFIRTSWGNNAPPVTAEQVKVLRESTDPTSDHVVVLKMR